MVLLKQLYFYYYALSTQVHEENIIFGITYMHMHSFEKNLRKILLCVGIFERMW